MQVEGSSAIVFGGASGLGEASARRLHEHGALVTIADLNEEKGAGLAGELGDEATFARVDVTNPDEVEAAVAEASRREGGLRINVCCAGVGWAEKVAGKRGPHQLQPFETVIGINLIGTFNALRFSAAAMLGNDPNAEGERGVCVNTASAAAYEGQVGQLAYAASKGGIVGMTLPAARDLAGNGVRVVTIAPGLFNTPLFGLLPQEQRDALGATVPFPNRLGEPTEFAQLVQSVVENPMLNGEVIRLDGALRMAPR
jgi:3-hydroxyacyl-CoA dehydrogenase / 3-hydroxy-2-methylbutyryl-CoA dehydrogenase